jgi:hypothetical protein
MVPEHSLAIHHGNQEMLDLTLFGGADICNFKVYQSPTNATSTGVANNYLGQVPVGYDNSYNLKSITTQRTVR